MSKKIVDFGDHPQFFSTDEQAEKLRRALLSVQALAHSEDKSLQVLDEFPGDSQLIHMSAMYRKSRKAFLGYGGHFVPSFISIDRATRTPTILSNTLFYSPIASEWFDLAKFENSKFRTQIMLLLRAHTHSKFHEQNHFVLFNKISPNTTTTGEQLRMYLNFCEAMSLSLDLVLGHQMGVSALQFCMINSINRPDLVSKRDLADDDLEDFYALLVIVHYLILESYEIDSIEGYLKARDLASAEIVEEAIDCVSKSVDKSFVEKTNPEWQSQYSDQVLEFTNTLGSNDRIEFDFIEGQINKEFFEFAKKVILEFV